MNSTNSIVKFNFKLSYLYRIEKQSRTKGRPNCFGRFIIAIKSIFSKVRVPLSELKSMADNINRMKETTSKESPFFIQLRKIILADPSKSSSIKNTSQTPPAPPMPDTLTGNPPSSTQAETKETTGKQERTVEPMPDTLTGNPPPDTQAEKKNKQPNLSNTLRNRVQTRRAFIVDSSNEDLSSF